MALTAIHSHPPVAATILPAGPEDEWAVRLLFAALHAFNAELESRFALGPGWGRALAQRLATDRATGEGLALLAWDGDEPIGLALLAGQTDPPLFRHRRWAALEALYVVPEARSAGVGDRLVAAALGWAREWGYRRVQLHLTAADGWARRFAAQAGFRPLQEVWALELGSTGSAAVPPDEAS